MVAFCKNFPNVAKDGVAWATNRGFRNLLIEGDSLQVIGALQNPTTNLSSLGQIIEDTKAELRSITEDLCTHIYRQANNVSHHLARYSLSLGSESEWLSSPPPFILDLLVEDSL